MKKILELQCQLLGRKCFLTACLHKEKHDVKLGENVFFWLGKNVRLSLLSSART